MAAWRASRSHGSAHHFLIGQLGSDVKAVTLDLSVDWRVLGFTAAAALAATFLFGLAPALGLGRVEPGDALKDQSRTIAGDRRSGLRNMLVVGPGRAFVCPGRGRRVVRPYVWAADEHALGFDPSNLLVVRVDAVPGSVPLEAKPSSRSGSPRPSPRLRRPRASLSRITP